MYAFRNEINRSQKGIIPHDRCSQAFTGGTRAESLALIRVSMSLDGKSVRVLRSEVEDAKSVS